MSSKTDQPNVRVGIGVFVFRNGKFLMGQRRSAHGAGTWAVPGGHQEFGETWAETATREVLEETGMKIKNVRFGAVTDDFFKDEGKHYTTIWVISDWDLGEPTITEPDKFVQQEWFDFDNLPEPLFLVWDQLKPSQFYENLKLELDKSKVDR